MRKRRMSGSVRGLGEQSPLSTLPVNTDSEGGADNYWT